MPTGLHYEVHIAIVEVDNQAGSFRGVCEYVPTEKKPTWHTTVFKAMESAQSLSHVMPEHHVGVSWHDAGPLAHVAKKELKEAERVLDLLRRICDGDNTAMRCHLPETLANLPLEELKANIDPWCSEVIFWRNWSEKLAAIAKKH